MLNENYGLVADSTQHLEQQTMPVWPTQGGMRCLQCSSPGKLAGGQASCSLPDVQRRGSAAAYCAQ